MYDLLYIQIIKKKEKKLKYKNDEQRWKTYKLSKKRKEIKVQKRWTTMKNDPISKLEEN